MDTRNKNRCTAKTVKSATHSDTRVSRAGEDGAGTGSGDGGGEQKTVHQAAPMLCIPKKDGVKLRTALDARKRNDNTYKDVTPFPDQEQIRHDVARGKY